MIKKYEKSLSLYIFFILIILVFYPLVNASEQFQENYITPMSIFNYHSYSEMTDLLMNHSLKYPEIMSLTSIGKTYEGRDIWLVKISDNVNKEEDEPGVLLMGAHHGNEKPSYEVLIFFINYMLQTYEKDSYDNDNDNRLNEDPFDGVDNDGDRTIDEDPPEEQVKDAIEKTQFYIIPMVNPDGVEANTRKNRAPNYGPDGTSEEITSLGVDLNRNYGYRWNIVYLFPDNYFFEWITNDESWTYRGETPFCENETKAIKSFVDTHNISISLSYHDYGEWMIFPWMHSSSHTPHESLFRSIGTGMANINKYELRIFGQYGTREYLIPRFQGTPGSSENWLYGEHEIISYTIELCSIRPEFRAWEIYEACWKHVGVNLYVSERSLTIDEDKKSCKVNHIHNTFSNIIEEQYLTNGKFPFTP